MTLPDRDAASVQTRRRFYGWWLAVVGAMVIALMSGPLHSLELRASNLGQYYQWSDIELGLVWLLLVLGQPAIGLFGGWCVERLGPRRMVFIGLVVLGGGALLFSYEIGLTTPYLSFAMVSLGVGLGTTLPMYAALVNWFRQRLATALSITLAGSTLGIWLIDELISRILEWNYQRTPGTLDLPVWETIALAIGLIALASAPLLGWLVRNQPEDYGQHPDGLAWDGRPDTPPYIPVQHKETMLAPEYGWWEAVRSRQFGLLLIASVCTSVGAGAFDIFTESDGGEVWPMSAIRDVTALAAIVAGGILCDRKPMRFALCGMGIMAGMGTVLAVAGGSAASSVGYWVVIAGDWGMRAGGVAVWAVYFGRRRFTTIFATATFFMALGRGVIFPLILLLAAASGGTLLVAIAAPSFWIVGSALYLRVEAPQLARRQQGRGGELEGQAASP